MISTPWPAASSQLFHPSSYVMGNLCIFTTNVNFVGDVDGDRPLPPVCGGHGVPTAFGYSAARPFPGVTVRVSHQYNQTIRSGSDRGPMSETASTHIRVSEQTREELWERKQGPGDTYEDVIRRELGL